MSETIIVETRGQADWVTLNRPESMNAITPELCDALADYFAGLPNKPDTRVVVLRGAGRTFCAGLDLKARAESDAQGADGVERLTDIIRDMRRCPQIVVALLHGAAAGGGFAFALAADIRIAAEKARMNAAFVKLGINGCELGISYFLPRYLGLSLASELTLTGRFLHADRAYQLGLVSEVVPESELEAAGERLVQDLLAASPKGLRKTKETLNRNLGIDDIEAVTTLELAVQLECMKSPNFDEAVSAFVEKRPPQFVAD